MLLFLLLWRIHIKCLLGSWKNSWYEENTSVLKVITNNMSCTILAFLSHMGCVAVICQTLNFEFFFFFEIKVNQKFSALKNEQSIDMKSPFVNVSPEGHNGQWNSYGYFPLEVSALYITSIGDISWLLASTREGVSVCLSVVTSRSGSPTGQIGHKLRL